MRIRTIKPEMWSHRVLSKLEDSVRLLAIGLLSYADDEGYFFFEPALIRAAIFPFDEDSTKVRRGIEELSKNAVSFIEIIESEQGQIGHIINFEKHQKIDRKTASKIKQYIDNVNTYDYSTNTRRMIDENSFPEQGNREQGTREQGNKGTGNKGGEILNFVDSEIFRNVSSYFSLSEIRNPNDLIELNRFLNLRQAKGNLCEFEKQFAAYREYKKTTKQATHSFKSFIGDLAKDDGGWLTRDWAAELKTFQPRISQTLTREEIFE